MVLSAGLDALNELNDLGLLSNEPTDQELQEFNGTTLRDELVQIAETFRKYVPGQRWDWLETAGQLFEGVEASIERHEGIWRSTMTHSGQSSVVHFDFKARPHPRQHECFLFQRS